MNTVLRSSIVSSNSFPVSPLSAMAYALVARYEYAGDLILPSILREVTPRSRRSSI